VSSKPNFSREYLAKTHPGRETAGTFRDPAGQLYLTPTHAVRRIHPGAAQDTLAFLTSPLRAALEQSGDLIESKKIGEERDEIWLEHPRVDPISYPWEWCAAQWLAAAEVTLRVADQALDAGWTLKDATPLNIVFRGTTPVLVDVLSFERSKPTASTWPAYGQFVRTFLLPLIAAKYLNWSLQATLLNRDGYEPRELYRSLRFWQRIHPDLVDVVTLAAFIQPRSGASQKLPSVSDPELAKHILHKRLARLGKQVRRAANTTRSTEWSEYQAQASHYSSADKEDKQRFVRRVLKQCGPGRVLDIGANTGTYSLLAAESGAEVVAIDSDAGAIENLWKTATQQGNSITALVANIARPTPPMGWKNREQLSLLDRLAGQFDMVLLLAVIHHLILREQIPLGHIGELCDLLTRRWVLVEWVPPSDAMYQEWLRGRENLYGQLSEDDLLLAFRPYFHPCDRRVLGNNRVLLLFERNHVVEERPRATMA